MSTSGHGKGHSCPKFPVKGAISLPALGLLSGESFGTLTDQLASPCALLAACCCAARLPDARGFCCVAEGFQFARARFSGAAKGKGQRAKSHPHARRVIVHWSLETRLFARDQSWWWLPQARDANPLDAAPYTVFCLGPRAHLPSPDDSVLIMRVYSAWSLGATIRCCPTVIKASEAGSNRTIEPRLISTSGAT